MRKSNPIKSNHNKPVHRADMNRFATVKNLWACFTKTILIAWLGSLCSCKGQAQPSDPVETYAIAADTVTVVTSKPALAQKYETAYRAFKQQEHRFEFDRCKLYYNGRQLKLDTLSEMEKQLGNDYIDHMGFWFQNKPVSLIVKRKFIGEPFNSPVAGIATSLSIKMSQFEKPFTLTYSEREELIRSVPILEGYVLIDGVPINATMPIEEVNRRLSRDVGLVFSPYWSSFLFNMRYSSIGLGFPKCVPDDRISERQDWIYISIGYKEDMKTIYQITYEYTIRGTE